MNVEKIWLDGLQIGARLRDVDPDKVESLAASMSAIGLRQPISVWADDEGGVHLVAGLHRVKAAELLEWETIDAIVVDMNEIDRRLWEIAENLHRAELTALERSEHVAQWIALTEQAAAKAAAASEQDVRDSRGGKPGQNVQVSKGGRGKKSGLSQAARELNIPGKTEDAKRKNAERAVKVASLTEEAKETAREVGLDDNRSALLQAAAAAPEEQPRVLRDIAKEKAREPEEHRVNRNQSVSADELNKIRALGDFDLIMLISEIHEHGWPVARKTLRMMERAA